MVALSGKHGALRERNGVVWRVGAAVERERAVASAVAKERAANVAAIAERDRAIEAWKCARANTKEREAAGKQRLANAATLVVELRRRLAVLESIFDGEPSFAD